MYAHTHYTTVKYLRATNFKTRKNSTENIRIDILQISDHVEMFQYFGNIKKLIWLSVVPGGQEATLKNLSGFEHLLRLG